MCGRFVLYDVPEIVERFKIQVGADQLELVRDTYNAAPGQYMPVIIEAGGKHAVDIMKWGLIPHWAKDEKIGYKLINTRAESAFDKPAWRGPVKYRRCLVPARGFYEWKRSEDGKTKQPYFIYPADQDIFCFAGVWETWIDPAGSEIRSFSIMTTEPNKEMRDIHNRMPVILPEENIHKWLNSGLTDREEIGKLMLPYPDGHLRMHKVTTDVNSPKHNTKELIYELPG